MVRTVPCICRDCRFSFLITPELVDGEEELQCRRHAPQALSMNETQHVNYYNQDGSTGRPNLYYESHRETVFPVVSEEMWCGEGERGVK